MSMFTRAFALEDCRIATGGDGRTVEAYAAVFDVEQEIVDGQGHYLERIDKAAFNKTIADNGTNFRVLFNHGMTIFGTPSEIDSLPIGTPVEVRPDNRGVFTRTRYHRGERAESVLEAIREGSLTAQSFSGSWIRSDIPTPRGGFRADKSGALTVVTRQEVRMKEYGPATFAAYPDAAIVGVRAVLAQLTEQERALLLTLPTDEAEQRSDTSHEAVTDEPREAHSGRTHHFHSLRKQAREKGVL